MAFKIIFAGTPEFSVDTLVALINSEHEIVAVYTQPDRPAGRGRKVTASCVKEVALEHNIPVYQPSTLTSEEEVRSMAALAADMMVVVAYGLILPEKVLNVFPRGCLNVHASLLPRWRGAAPIQRAILAGDHETGVTIMQMEKGLDTGPMLNHISCPVLARDTSNDLHERLSAMGADALLIALEDMAMGRKKAEKQDDSLSTHAAKIEKAEARIDWSQSAEDIHRAIRAYNPWPIAFTELNGQTIRIWDADLIQESATQPPGTIIISDKQGVDVATDNGQIRIEKLQLPGGKILTVQEILNAHKDLFSPGHQFQ